MKVERPKVVPLVEQLGDELEQVQRAALAAQGEVIEPTADERKNGWTAETLTLYLAERDAGQSLAVDVNSLQRRVARRPQESNHRYRPLRWRG